MRILISGWYGHGNIGDELLLDLFLDHFSSHKVKVLTSEYISADRVPSVHHCDLWRFDSGGMKQWLNGRALKLLAALIACDCFVLGGGGIIRERGNLRNLRRILDEVHIAKAFGKKALVYGVSIGPIESEEGESLVASALRKCDYITVRDHASVEYLERYSIPQNRYALMADPVFSMNIKGKTDQCDGELGKHVLHNGLIPLFLTHSLAETEKGFVYLEAIADSLERANQAFGLRFIAIPFRVLEDGRYDDCRCASDLKIRTKSDYVLECYNKVCSAQDIVCAMSAADFTICVRLHSVILSIVSKTPFVAISYDKKVRDTAELAGLSDCVVDVTTGLSDELFEQIGRQIDQHELLASRVNAASDVLADSSRQVFDRLDKHLLD